MIAHRGALRQAPENTLPAIAKALAAGVDMVALEVQGTRDQAPLVLADPRVDRTTNGGGRVNQMTAAEVGALDAGSWFGAEYAGTKVPGLEEALAAVGDRARVMLALPETASAALLREKLAAALRKRSRPAEDVLLCPNSEEVKCLRAQLPDFRYALALGEKVEGWVCVEKTAKLGLQVVRPYRRQVSSGMVREAHAKGLKVYAYFADEEKEMEELLRAGVDGIVTGQLERLKRLREAQG